MITMTKTCSNCGETKEDSEFYRTNKKCRRCVAAYRKKYYKDNRDVLLAKAKQNREANRETRATKQREYYAANRELRLVKNKEYYEANKEVILAQKKQYREDNKEATLATQKKCYEANKAAYAVTRKKYYEDNKHTIAVKGKKYYEANKEAVIVRQKKYYEANKSAYYSYNAKRRAQKLKATPSWSNLDAIKAIYELRETISEVSGVVHHVDHIHPLQSDVVCGLHVLENLQIIPATENLSKSNKFIEEGGL